MKCLLCWIRLCNYTTKSSYKNRRISDKHYAAIRLGEDEKPFRTLTYPSNSSRNARDSPLFYYNPNLPIRGQEAILRSSAYPSNYHTPNNFWVT